jgi:hypothetical protein
VSEFDASLKRQNFFLALEENGVTKK